MWKKENIKNTEKDSFKKYNDDKNNGEKNNLKRFFKPLSFRKRDYYKFFIRAFFEWINLVIHVLFLERITYFLETKNIEDFNNILIFYIIYILVFEIFYFTTKKWWWMTTMPMWKSDIFNHYLEKYIKLDNNQVERVWTGKLIWIIDKWVDEWVLLITNIIEKWVILIVSVMFTFYMVWKVDLKYALCFLILLVIFFFIWRYTNAKLWTFRKIRYELRNTRLKLLVKVLMSKIEILQNKKIKSETEKIRLVSEKLSSVNMDMSFYRTISNRFSQFTISLVLFSAFWYLWNKYLEWEFTLSALVWLTGTLIIMQKTIYETVKFYIEYTKKMVSVEKFWDFFDNTPLIKWYDKWETFIYKSGGIEIKNMCFGYWWNKEVFDNLNLSIPWWKVLALVWNSWSWKTTLVKLLSWYLRHDSGYILVDKQNIKDISLKTLYPHIWYLTQEPSVFDWTIIENLMYGIEEWKTNNNSPIIPFHKGGEHNKSRDVWQKHLKKIIKQAKCEFIYDFEKWLETEIWEKWIRLSWWQRQRLAIAKIFLKDPKIIILDEPTSALDSFSEEQITIAMENLFAWRTVIIIAHRLQTVRNASHILVMKNWEIAEEGNHKELVEKSWIYKKMLDLQSGF